LLDQQPLDAMVVACNTATAGAIDDLRRATATCRLSVWSRPSSRSAQMSHTGHVGVLATRGTLSSRRYARIALSRTEAAFPGVHFSCQACEGLADAIERGDPTRVLQLCRASMDATACTGKPSSTPRSTQLVLGAPTTLSPAPMS
jgi:glutamate racemase